MGRCLSKEEQARALWSKWDPNVADVFWSTKWMERGKAWSQTFLEKLSRQPLGTWASHSCWVFWVPTALQVWLLLRLHGMTHGSHNVSHLLCPTFSIMVASSVSCSSPRGSDWSLSHRAPQRPPSPLWKALSWDHKRCYLKNRSFATQIPREVTLPRLCPSGV